MQSIEQRRAYQLAWYHAHKKDDPSYKEKARKRTKIWRDANEERAKESTRQYKLNHPEKIKAYAKKSKDKHREKVREAERVRYRKNPELYRERGKQRYLKNRQLIRKQTDEWKKNNPELVRKYQRISRNRRYKHDISYRIVCALRNRVRKTICGEYKSDRAIGLLGCSITDFRIYIESKFEPGMSWENYGRGGWHLDHIMPCAIFDFTKAEHQKRCFHFSNYQPLWQFDNLSKRDKILSNQFNLI